MNLILVFILLGKNDIILKNVRKHHTKCKDKKYFMLQQRMNVIMQMSDTQFLAYNIVPHSSDMDIHKIIFWIKKKYTELFQG